MKNNRKKDLIDYMAEELKAHSLPYKEGAWEQFALKHGGEKPLSKKKLLDFWPYVTSVAAVVLLGLGLFLWQDKTLPENAYMHTKTFDKDNRTEDRDTNPEGAGRREGTGASRSTDEMAFGHPPAMDGETVDGLYNKKRPVADNKRKNAGGHADPIINGELTEKSILLHADGALIVVNEQLDAEPHKNGQQLAALADEPVNVAVTNVQDDALQDGVDLETKSLVAEKSAIERLLEKEPLNDQKDMASVKKMGKSKKWGFGVAVSPLMTEEQFNIGGGLTIAYQLTDKLSLGSGLSVVDLSVSNNQVVSGNTQVVMEAVMDKSSSMTIAVAGNKQLSSISSNVLGLDIPIDFRYRLTKNFYLGAGASLFTVLRENRANNYVSQMDNSQLVVSRALATSSVPEIRTVRTSEATAETPLEDGGYSTFLNFSVGRRIPLSSRIGISVEPFYKLPVGKINNQNMNFNYGGMRIITSF